MVPTPTPQDIDMTDTAENTRLTLSQFQATGIDTDDLRQVQPDNYPLEHYTDPMPARTYAGDFGLYINRDPDGTFSVDIGRFSKDGSLEACEIELYAFYVSECVSDDVRAALQDAAPESTYHPRLPDTEESLYELLTAWCVLHGVKPMSADELIHEDVTDEQRAWLNDFIRRWDAVLLADKEAKECESSDSVAAGPWHVDADLEATFAVCGRTETVYEITNATHDETLCYATAEHARRIVACMNACAGIDTATLESGSPVRLIAAINRKG